MMHRQNGASALAGVVLLVAGMLDTPGHAKEARGRLRLLVPEKAFVFVAGTRMTSTGSERIFESPLLPSDRQYRYEISVIFEGCEIVREVIFQPGKTVEVDFREAFQKLSSPPLPSPFKPLRREWLPGRVWRA